MDGNLSLILAFLVSISVVLALVIKFKLHPFLSLFIGCLLMGVCSGLDPMAIIKTSCKGFGDTMGDIGIIILLGVAMGQILHESGCTREIANTMLRLCGREKSALALNLTGYIISIPVFFDAAFVILIGLIREMAREGKLALNTLVTALVVGLTCTHALVIPTPGPVAVAGNMGADIGWFIVYGVLIALPASLIGGVLYGKFLGRKSPIFLTDEEPDAALVEQALAKSDHPSGALGIAIIFLPIMLIFFANILNAFLDPASSASRVVSFFGNTNIVLLITVFVAYFSLARAPPRTFRHRGFARRRIRGLHPRHHRRGRGVRGRHRRERHQHRHRRRHAELEHPGHPARLPHEPVPAHRPRLHYGLHRDGLRRARPGRFPARRLPGPRGPRHLLRRHRPRPAQRLRLLDHLQDVRPEHQAGVPRLPHPHADFRPRGACRPPHPEHVRKLPPRPHVAVPRGASTGPALFFKHYFKESLWQNFPQACSTTSSAPSCAALQAPMSPGPPA